MQLLQNIAKRSEINVDSQQKGGEAGQKAVKIKTKRMLNYHLIY
jgi:hypothetical protein